LASEQIHFGSQSPAGILARVRSALESRFAASGELTPRQVARTVIAALPDELGHWLSDWLRCGGFLEADARIPFDVLDSAAEGAGLRGLRREAARLALFGLGGQGIPANAKRRETVYRRWCAEIVREMHDLQSLQRLASRALADPEVRQDAELFNMLSGFIAEREADARAREHDRVEDEQRAEQRAAPRAARRPADPASAPIEEREFHRSLAERVTQALSKLRVELEVHLSHYRVSGAREVLEKIRDYGERYPGYVNARVVERSADQVRRLIARRDEFREQLAQLRDQGAAAAKGGDQKTAAWVIRRLSAVHTLLPAVLPAQMFEELTSAITSSGESFEQQEMARELIERERKIRKDIQRLGAIVHRFHNAATRDSDDPELKRSIEAKYRDAVREVRAYDDEWLADLMIELDCLLQDLHDPSGKADEHVGRFVDNVRNALNHIRRDIRTIQKERSAPSGS